MKLLLSCLFLAASTMSVRAQIAQKVIFTGDSTTFGWQTTPQFLANPNWVGAGVAAPGTFAGPSVATDFQANVINEHPAFVVIEMGIDYIGEIHGSIPLGVAWHMYELDLMQMVSMAQKARIKIILGNVTGVGYNAQLMNVWLGQYALANGIPVMNVHDAICQCTGLNDTAQSIYQGPVEQGPQFVYPVNAAGSALMTQMAETAIATYGLTIKGGYLSNVKTIAFDTYQPLPPQVNNVVEGEEVTFTPQAKWSDGGVRPMLNHDSTYLKGTWTSSNPFIMTINQQGQAYAYGVGTATISFKSSTGVSFSPWTMTVTERYTGAI